jgi:hypothetical protein
LTELLIFSCSGSAISPCFLRFSLCFSLDSLLPAALISIRLLNSLGFDLCFPSSVFCPLSSNCLASLFLLLFRPTLIAAPLSTTVHSRRYIRMSLSQIDFFTVCPQFSVSQPPLSLSWQSISASLASAIHSLQLHSLLLDSLLLDSLLLDSLLLDPANPLSLFPIRFLA